MIYLMDGQDDLRPNGAVTKRVVLLGDGEPASLALSGADVEGMNPGDVIARGSVLITPEANYIAFTDGTFTRKG